MQVGKIFKHCLIVQKLRNPLIIPRINATLRYHLEIGEHAGELKPGIYRFSKILIEKDFRTLSEYPIYSV